MMGYVRCTTEWIKANPVSYAVQSSLTASAMIRKIFTCRTAVWTSLLCVPFLLVACSLGPPPGVTPVNDFQLSRYLGTWYEIARLDHSFERGMSDVSARYSLNADGSVRVLNRGFDTAKDNWREAEGRALFIGSDRVGSLKVSFFGPFYGGYHVAALDPDYRWSLVIGPDPSYAWILARDKNLDADARENILKLARQAGVDVSALIWVSHARRNPALASTESPAR